MKLRRNIVALSVALIIATLPLGNVVWGGGEQEVTDDKTSTTTEVTESTTETTTQVTTNVTTETVTTTKTTTAKTTVEAKNSKKKKPVKGVGHTVTTDGHGTIVSDVLDPSGWAFVEDRPSSSAGHPWVCTKVTVSGVETETPAYGQSKSFSYGGTQDATISVDETGLVTVQVLEADDTNIVFSHEQISLFNVRGYFWLQDISTDVSGDHKIYWDGQDHRLFHLRYYVDVYNRNFSRADIDKTLHALCNVNWEYSKDGTVLDTYSHNPGRSNTHAQFVANREFLYDTIDDINGRALSGNQLGVYRFALNYNMDVDSAVVGNQYGAHTVGTGTSFQTEIVKRPITVESGGGTKIEDGTPLTSSSLTASTTEGLGLAPGNYMTADLTASQTTVGTTPNTISNLKIFDASGNDVTANYDVTLAPGNLIVTADPMATRVITYEGTTDTNGHVECLLQGDANGDGRITIEDQRTIQQMLVGGIPTPAVGTDDFWCLDISENGIISMVDSIAVLRLLIEGDTSPQTVKVKVKDTADAGYVLKDLTVNVTSSLTKNKVSDTVTMAEGTIQVRTGDHVVFHVTHEKPQATTTTETVTTTTEDTQDPDDADEEGDSNSKNESDSNSNSDDSSDSDSYSDGDNNNSNSSNGGSSSTVAQTGDQHDMGTMMVLMLCAGVIGVVTIYKKRPRS